MRFSILFSALASLAALASGCARGDAPGGGANVERTVRGDTSIVRTISGSAWGDTARLVEDLRIGALEGPPELAFGDILHVVPAPDGSVYAFDAQAIALRQYASDGRFLRTIGARGQGPGEYEGGGALRVLRDGRVALFDAREARVTIYGPAGVFQSTWKAGLSTWSLSENAFSMDSAGRAWILTSARPDGPAAPRRSILLRFATDGTVVDTVEAPPEGIDAREKPVLHAPGGHWTLHPHGYFVAGTNDRYSIAVAHPDRPMRIERAVEPVQFEAGERAEIEAQIAARPLAPRAFSVDPDGRRTVTAYFERPTLAPIKPFFSAIRVADDGRIWVELYTRARKAAVEEALRDTASVNAPGTVPSTWREPAVWDVFDPDGSYLGPVRAPDRTVLTAIGRDHVWGIHRGESDEEYVVRLRLVLPSKR